MRLRHSAAWFPLRRRWLVAALINGGVAVCAPVHADEGDVLRPYVGLAFTHEDNITGVTNDAAAGGTPRVSDTVRRLDAGVIFDKMVGRQHLTAEANLSRNEFQDNGNLDYTGRDVRANWRWRVGDHIDGDLGASYSRALSSLQEFFDPALNLRAQLPTIRTQDRQYLNAAWQFHPSARVRGGVSRYALDYDNAAQQAGNRRVNEAVLGMDYLARSGSTAGLEVRHAEGDFPFSPGTNYEQQEINARVEWKITGKTDLQFVAGWVERDNDAPALRDYSGFNGRVGAVWRATGKTTVNAVAWRDIAARDDLTATFSVNKGVSVGVGWEVTAKSRVDGYVLREERDYSAAGAAREDTVGNASLTLTYYPLRNLRLQATVFHTDVDSSAPFVAYRNKGMTLGTRLEF